MGPDDELNGANPTATDTTPLSYDADLNADVRGAYDELEKGTGAEPAADGKAADTTRDPATGRFAKRAGDSVSGSREPAAGQGAAAGDQRPAQSTAPPAPDAAALSAVAAAPSAPPSSWSVASKAAWAALPEHVRADIAKRESEVDQGFAALRDFKDVKQYADMARDSGTTLAAALQRYTTMEGTLRQDPMQGMMAIAHNVGLSKQQAAQLFANLGAVLGARPTSGPRSEGGQPTTDGLDQNDPLVAVLGPILEQRLGPLANKLGTLESHLTRQREADQNAELASLGQAIEAFSKDPKNLYFPDLEETISRLFETGMIKRTRDAAADLRSAYDMAANLHPEVREALIEQRLKTKAGETSARDKAAGARALAASRSITGSTSDVTPAANKKRRDGASYDADLNDDVRAAYAELEGRA